VGAMTGMQNSPTDSSEPVFPNCETNEHVVEEPEGWDSDE